MRPQAALWFPTTHPCPRSLQAPVAVPRTPAEEKRDMKGTLRPGDDDRKTMFVLM